MLHRRAPILAALAVLAAACTESVEQNGAPDEVVIASFDTTTPAIPLPNDLALAGAPRLPAGFQKELLQSFIAKGGFPSDQELPITIPVRAFARNPASGEYDVPRATPLSLDLGTVNESTVAVVKVAPGPAERVAVEVGGFANGVLTIRKAAVNGSRRWAPGRYVAALRGGEHGVKTTDGRAIGAQDSIALISQDTDLTNKENQPPGGLSPEQVAQLQQLKGLYANPVDWNGAPPDAPTTWQPGAPAQGQLSAFAAVDTVFPHDELASVQTFETQPAATMPLTDTGSGQIPFPSDFLLDPATGKVRNNPAFGPAAAGLATLDGFSTTGMMLVPLSGPVQETTVNASSVLVFELPATSGGTPRRMRDVAAALQASAPGTAEYLTQPPALGRDVQGMRVTTTLGLQPAVPVPTPTAAGIVYLPPLKEKTRYAVVVTNRIKDTQNQGLRRSTLAEMVFGFESPLVVDGKSQIPGVSDADAAGLQGLRDGLAPLLDNLGALSGDAALTRDDVVLAYTIKTQTVTEVSVKLSAAPYDPNGDGNPADSVAFTATGIDPITLAELGLAQAAPLLPSVAELWNASFVSLDAIDPANGALNPNPAAWTPTQLTALVAVPAVPDTCTPSIPCVQPLVVWHHGINGGRLQMLGVAESFASRGAVVVAVDAPYHGDRAFCAQNSDCATETGADGVCTPDPARAGQGDDVPPGTCTVGSLRMGSNLTTEASGNYFISGNFFRIRDGIRQDLFDHAALILAAARPPTLPQPAGNALSAALLQKGIVVNPAQVYLEGLSLGGINGAEIVATNPRVSRAVLSMPGGTLTDIFTNAPAFKESVDELFLSLGIDRAKVATDPAVAARYLQTLILAKWILDPADPINYAKHLTAKLPSPLAGGASAPTAVLGQLAKCDQVVPNATTVVDGVPLAFGDLLLTLDGGVNKVLYTSASDPNGCVPHGVLLDTFQPGSIGGPVREDAAGFLLEGASVPATRVLPAP